MTDSEKLAMWQKENLGEELYTELQNKAKPMTDNEIVKALECCCKNNNCDGCPLDYLTFSSQCASELAIKSLDIINRQKAEIERLNKEVETFADIGKMYSEIKAEAYRECMLQLEAEIESSDKYIREYDDSELQKAYNKGLRDALKALKELVGEDDA